MDIQSAIENLKSAKEIQLKEFSSNDIIIDFYDSIISALQELRQYRGLCKPEEIEHMKSLARIIRCHGIIGKALEACANYEEVGSLEECREAVEKQKQKKPIKAEESRIRYTEGYICPRCGGGFSGTGIAGYCYHCGQAIDWSEEE